MGKLELTTQCPVIPGHGNSVMFGECEHCGLLVIGCLDGCSERQILEALFPDPADRPQGSGHEITMVGGSE